MIAAMTPHLLFSGYKSVGLAAETLMRHLEHSSVITTALYQSSGYALDKGFDGAAHREHLMDLCFS